MKNTTPAWVQLIKYRLQCEQDGYPNDYLASVIKALNNNYNETDDVSIFMDNIGHVLTVQYLGTLTIKNINSLFEIESFANDVNKFFSFAEPLALDYTLNYRINYQQYCVFKTLLSFDSIQNVAKTDKKRFILTLKRSKNSNDVV